MADYYVLYSAEIEGLTGEETEWVRSRLEEIEAAEIGGNIGCPGEIEIEDGTVWFHSDDSGDPKFVAEFVRDFLKRFRPDDCFALEYALTCSKLRLDGFGGGAAFVTAERIEWTDTAAWVEERRRNHDVRFEGTDETCVSRSAETG